MKKIVGLDLGVGSVGWAIVEADDENYITHIVDLGSYVFSELENPKDGKLENVVRRNKRSTRRLTRRKKLRLLDLDNLFKQTFNKSFYNINLSNFDNPYELKVKGLSKKLSEEEIMIILHHYMKYRGFKSSRKATEESDKEAGKILSKIKETKNALDGRYITQYLLEKFEQTDIAEKRIHNKGDNYIMTVSREMYLDEINKIFEVQRSYGQLQEEFCESFLKIYKRQRNFSEGPGGNSPFGKGEYSSLIEKMTGKCQFDQKPRAPKQSYSAQKFLVLSFLNNIRYKETKEGKYQSLSPEEIQSAFNLFKERKGVSYSNIFKQIDKSVYNIKDLDCSKKQRITFLNKFKEKKGINSQNLPAEYYSEFNEYVRQELLKTPLKVSLSDFHNLKTMMESSGIDENKIQTFISNEENLDIVDEIIFYNKTDDAIRKACDENGFDSQITAAILKMPDSTETINLSVNLCKKINPLLLEGNTYDKAMEKAGLDFHGTVNVKKEKYLPEIDTALFGIGEELANPVVRHTLVNMRKVINEIIKQYGDIDEINVELGRELKRTFDDRKEIRNKQNENRDNNSLLREEMLKKFPNIFPGVNKISNDDLVKYKLFKEQKGYCAYSGERINESQLFDKSKYEVDHILPYSRSFDDSYQNKALVTKKMNQDKKNRTPREFNSINNNVLNNIYKLIETADLSEKKKQNLLADELPEDFKSRNLNDTSYLSRLTVKLLSSYLISNVHATNGSVTDKLKFAWRLQGHTHSYASKDKEYRNIDKYQIDDINDVEIKPKEIVINFKSGIDKKDKEMKLTIKTATEKKPLTSEEEDINSLINYANEKPTMIKSQLEKYVGKGIDDFVSNIGGMNYSDNTNLHLSELGDQLVTLSSQINQFIAEDRLTKDRGNDLHHALDAAIIACTTQKLINNVENYYLNHEESDLMNNMTGVISDDIKKFPLPYGDFRKEVLARVYERNAGDLLDKLNLLNYYQKNPLCARDVQPLVPTRHPNKYNKGAFYGETWLGYKDGMIIKKVDVHKIKIPQGKKANEYLISLIYDSKGGNHPIVDALVDWFNSTSEKEREKTYPYHPTKGTKIKGVKIVDTDNPKDRVLVKSTTVNGKKNDIFAENENVIRVDFYRRKGKDDKLYAVPIYYYQIAREQNKNKGHEKKDIIYTIMSN